MPAPGAFEHRSRWTPHQLFLFDRGKAIFPSRPRLGCAAVSSGGQGWAPLGGHPKGLSLTAASTVAGFCSAGERPSKTVLSAPSESVILLIGADRGSVGRTFHLLFPHQAGIHGVYRCG